MNHSRNFNKINKQPGFKSNCLLTCREATHDFSRLTTRWHVSLTSSSSSSGLVLSSGKESCYCCAGGGEWGIFHKRWHNKPSGRSHMTHTCCCEGCTRKRTASRWHFSGSPGNSSEVSGGARWVWDEAWDRKASVRAKESASSHQHMWERQLQRQSDVRFESSGLLIAYMRICRIK